MKTKRVVLLVLALLALSAMLACSFVTRLFTGDNNVPSEEQSSGGEEEGANQESGGSEENLEPIVGTWRQIHFQGIGGRNNMMMLGGDWFNGGYYVGTMNVGRTPPSMCNPSVTIAPVAPEGPVAPGGQVVTPETASPGAELWRTRDGVGWEVIGQPGFGDPAYTSFSPFTFQSRLYVATGTNVSLQVSSDGQAFGPLHGEWENGGIDAALSHYFVNDLLLVSGRNKQKGLQAWLSPDGERFDKVIEDGLGDVANSGICGYRSTPLNGWRYLGVSNLTNGGELWRTRDGRSYEKVLTAGYDDPTRSTLCASVIHDGYQYVTMLGTYGRGPTRGVEAIRSADGQNWEKVIEDGFGLGDQGFSGSFVVYKNTLYFVLNNYPPQSGGSDSTGFRLWRSSDGRNWEQIGQPGFGYPKKYMAIPFVIRGVFYLIASGQCDANQIWRSTDGTNWELFYTFPLSGQQYGATLVEIANGLEYFEGGSSGIQIWWYAP